MEMELFGDYERLLTISVLGHTVQVPENNTLLRCLQYVAPQTITYGRFCWNGSCENCAVTVRNGSCEEKERACRLDAADGIEIVSASAEIRRNLM
jgi:hypothetical protein